MINFYYPPNLPEYTDVLDKIVDPILKHLPEGKKVNAPGQGLNVALFVEPGRKERCQAFIPHGIADKNYRNRLEVENFDHIFVSGPAMRDKYIRQGMNSNKIHIGGYTKLDPLFKTKKKKRKTPMVLWAPTHGNFDAGRKPATSSWPEFIDYVDKVPNLEIALHPNEKDKHQATMQQLLNASVVISDYGSLVYEALALGKPVIIPDWICKRGIMRWFLGSFEALIFEQGLCYHAQDFGHLLQLIDYALDSGINAKTQNFIDVIFPTDLRGRSGEVTAEILRGIADGS